MLNGRKKTRAALLFLLIALTAAGGYALVMLSLDRSPILNFEVVDEGKLFRSGQPRPGDLDWIKEKYGLETIFCLRRFEKDEVKQWVEKNGVRLISIEMRADIPPTDDQIGLFFGIMGGHTVELLPYKPIITQNLGFLRKEPVRFGFPVLIHCQGGADRTGVMVALYRMAFQGWSLSEARREMIEHFHLPFRHPAQFEFLEKIAPEIQAAFRNRTAADSSSR